MSLADIIQSKLEEYVGTSAGQKALREAKISSKDAQRVLAYWVDRLHEIIRKHTSGMVSQITGEAYLSKLKTVYQFSYRDSTASAEVSFAGDVYRRSVYPRGTYRYDPVYLPALINNDYEISEDKRPAYGYTRHGTYLHEAPRSWVHKEQIGFMNRIRDEFNAEAEKHGVRVELNEIYQ